MRMEFEIFSIVCLFLIVSSKVRMFVEIGKNLCIISENINQDEILNNYVAFDCICKLNSPENKHTIL